MAQKEPYLFSTEPDYGGGQIYTAQQPGETPIVAAPAAAPAPAPVQVAVTSAVVPTSTPARPTPQRAPTVLPSPVVVGTPRYSQADYYAAICALLPFGRAWDTGPDTVRGRTLMALAGCFTRSDAAASALLAGAAPGTLTSMLPEWEATLGLPDPCIGENPSIAERLDQVRGRFVGAGGQSRTAYIAFAAALGFLISIENYGGPRDSSGRSIFTWGVKIRGVTGTLSAEVLECELQAIKPAESTLIFI